MRQKIQTDRKNLRRKNAGNNRAVHIRNTLNSHMVRVFLIFFLLKLKKHITMKCTVNLKYDKADEKL